MSKTVDQPFRSKAEREMERALAAQYRELGNPEVAAAVRRQPQQLQQQAGLQREPDQQS